MKYRIATHKDHADIEDVIASTEYYPPVDASLMDGTFIVAEHDNGQLVGCLWMMHYGRNSYIDFVSVRPSFQHLGLGIRMLVKARSVLKRRGVRYVRGCVYLTNTEAIRMNESLGAVVHAPYAMCFADLGD